MENWNVTVNSMQITAKNNHSPQGRRWAQNALQRGGHPRRIGALLCGAVRAGEVAVLLRQLAGALLRGAALLRAAHGLQFVPAASGGGRRAAHRLGQGRAKRARRRRDADGLPSPPLLLRGRSLRISLCPLQRRELRGVLRGHPQAPRRPEHLFQRRAGAPLPAPDAGALRRRTQAERRDHLHRPAQHALRAAARRRKLRVPGRRPLPRGADRGLHPPKPQPGADRG